VLAGTAAGLLLAGGGSSLSAGVPLVVLAVFFFALGLTDDAFFLPVWIRLVAGLVGAVAWVLWEGGAGKGISPAGFAQGRLASTLAAALFVTGTANAANMADNIDAHASGCGVLSLAGLYLLGGGEGYSIAAFALGGFFAVNAASGRVYLGDSGALALGALLAAGLLRLRVPPIAAVLLGGMLFLDPAYAVSRRLLERRRPWRGGTDHLTHALARRLGAPLPAAGLLILIHGILVLVGLALASGKLELTL